MAKKKNRKYHWEGKAWSTRVFEEVEREELKRRQETNAPGTVYINFPKIRRMLKKVFKKKQI